MKSTSESSFIFTLLRFGRQPTLLYTMRLFPAAPTGDWHSRAAKSAELVNCHRKRSLRSSEPLEHT